MRHPHRKCRQREAKVSGRTLAQFSQAPEIWSYLLRFLEKWRDTHQPRKLQSRQFGNLFHQSWQLRNFHSTLRFLWRNAYFDQHAQPAGDACLRPRALQALCGREIIEGIDAVKKSRRPPRLVALKMANQMPVRRQSLGPRSLPFPLLHAVLAKVS